MGLLASGPASRQEVKVPLHGRKVPLRPVNDYPYRIPDLGPTEVTRCASFSLRPFSRWSRPRVDRVGPISVGPIPPGGRGLGRLKSTLLKHFGPRSGQNSAEPLRKNLHTD